MDLGFQKMHMKSCIMGPYKKTDWDKYSSCTLFCIQYSPFLYIQNEGVCSNFLTQTPNKKLILTEEYVTTNSFQTKIWS